MHAAEPERGVDKQTRMSSKKRFSPRNLRWNPFLFKRKRFGASEDAGLTSTRDLRSGFTLGSEIRKEMPGWNRAT